METRSPQASVCTVDDGRVETVSDTETDKPRTIAINVLNFIPRPSIISLGRTVAGITTDLVCPLPIKIIKLTRYRHHAYKHVSEAHHA